jgi:hypothetical protein
MKGLQRLSEEERDDSPFAPDHLPTSKDGVSKEGQKGFESESKDGGKESATTCSDSFAQPPVAYCAMYWEVEIEKSCSDVEKGR